MDLLKDVYNDFFADPSRRRETLKKLDELRKEELQKEKLRKEMLRKSQGEKTQGEKKSSSKKGSGNIPINGASPKTEEVSAQDAVKNAQDALEEARSLFDNPPGGLPTATAGMEAEPAKPEKKEPERDPEEELEELIGLKDIKHDVRELADFAKVQKMRKDQGLKSVPVSLHLVFTGNPGTGKTTVARILGRMYKKIGILSSGQLIEVDRSGLVAGYVGQTALKVQKVIQSAMGGVLFIDEAYALSQENDAFGQEAIDTLLKAMEDHRDNLIVIIAGYTGPMEKFINSNPGLKSRFNKYIEFQDYTVDELEAIFYLNCNKYEYVVDEDAKNQIRSMILLRKVKNPVNFANGREVRNMFEEIITNQARRVAAMKEPSQEELRRITTDDLVDNGGDEKTGDKEKTPEGKAGSDAGEKEPAAAKTDAAGKREPAECKMTDRTPGETQKNTDEASVRKSADPAACEAKSCGPEEIKQGSEKESDRGSDKRAGDRSEKRPEERPDKVQGIENEKESVKGPEKNV